MSEVDDVDWAALGHPCSGPSLPLVGRLLHEARSDDGENVLWGVVLHQGQIGEVTEHVLPFIFWLLTYEPQQRPRYVDWLADTSSVFASDREVDEGVRGVWRAAQVELLALLGDDVPYVRAITAGALSEIDEVDARVFAALDALADVEPDSGTARDVRYAVIRAARDDRSRRHARRRAEGWLADPEPELQLVGAHCLLWQDPGHSKARRHLLGLLPDGLGVSPYFGLGSVNTIVDDLCRQGLSGNDLAVVLGTLGRRGFFGDDVVSTRLLTLLFGPRGNDAPAGDLSDDQRALLRALTRVSIEQRNGGYTLVSGLKYELSVRGLPTDVKGLRRLARGGQPQ
jgi:hypothetical protein